MTIVQIIIVCYATFEAVAGPATRHEIRLRIPQLRRTTAGYLMIERHHLSAEWLRAVMARPVTRISYEPGGSGS